MKSSASYWGRVALYGFGHGLLGLWLGGILFAFVISTAISLMLLFLDKLQIADVLRFFLGQFVSFLLMGTVLSIIPAAFGGSLLGIWLYRDSLATRQPVKIVLLKSMGLGALLALGISLLVSTNLGPLSSYQHFYEFFVLSSYFPGWTLGICFSVAAVMAASIGSGWAGVRLARNISKITHHESLIIQLVTRDDS